MSISIDPRQLEAISQFAALLDVLKEPKKFFEMLEQLVELKKEVDEKLSKFKAFEKAEKFIESEHKSIAEYDAKLDDREAGLKVAEQSFEDNKKKTEDSLQKKERDLVAKEQTLAQKEEELIKASINIALLKEDLVVKETKLRQKEENLNIFGETLKQKSDQVKAILG